MQRVADTQFNLISKLRPSFYGTSVLHIFVLILLQLDYLFPTMIKYHQLPCGNDSRRVKDWDQFSRAYGKDLDFYFHYAHYFTFNCYYLS